MSNGDAPVAGEIDAWCTRCKLELNHIVVAKLDGKVKRVQCLTCGGQHGYSAAAGARARSPAKRVSKKKVVRRRVTEPDDGRPAKTYSVAATFVPDDVIQHPQYGRGRVVKARGNKIDVKFLEGAKTLIHARPIAG